MDHQETKKNGALGSLSKQVAMYGAALSALAIADAPSAQAGTIGLTPITSSHSGGLQNISFSSTAGGSVLSFSQWNDGVGKTMYAGSFQSETVQWRFANASSTISTVQSFTGFINAGASASGTQLFGFKTSGNRVGWISMQFTGNSTPIYYLSGAFNDTPEGAIHAGTGPGANAVPLPATGFLAGLGLLALGSVGVLRRRKAAAQG